jgi:hypothetical protein
MDDSTYTPRRSFAWRRTHKAFRNKRIEPQAAARASATQGEGNGGRSDRDRRSARRVCGGFRESEWPIPALTRLFGGDDLAARRNRRQIVRWQLGDPPGRQP